MINLFCVFLCCMYNAICCYVNMNITITIFIALCIGHKGESVAYIIQNQQFNMQMAIFFAQANEDIVYRYEPEYN